MLGTKATLVSSQRVLVGNGQPVVEVVGVAKRFGKVTALQDMNLAVQRGEFLTLLGPSGCGKTTLLRIIAGFEVPSEGRVLIAGRDITHLPPEKRPLNMVFQRYALFPHLDVADNIAFGLRLKRVPEPEINSRVAAAMALVRLEGFEKRLPHQLSGGQAQRVALARALVNEPEVLLLDEPLSALDRKIRLQMQEELRTIQATVGTTFLYVTHDQDEAMTMSTRVVLLHEGQITQVASPQELYLRPSSEFAANFIGDANVLEAQVVDHHGEATVKCCGLLLPGLAVSDRAPGQRVRLMVRPEAVHLAEDRGDGTVPGARGLIVRGSFYGFYWIHWVEVGEQVLIVREMGASAARQAGTAVCLSIDPRLAVILPVDAP